MDTLQIENQLQPLSQSQSIHSLTIVEPKKRNSIDSQTSATITSSTASSTSDNDNENENDNIRNSFVDKYSTCGVESLNLRNNEFEKENLNEWKDEFFHYISLYSQPYDEIHLRQFKDDTRSLEFLFQIIYSEYILFLPPSFFIPNCFQLKNKFNFLSYLQKYNIFTISYQEKYKIMYYIQIYNQFIKNTKEDVQKIVLKDLILYNLHLFNQCLLPAELKSSFIEKIYYQTRFKEIYFQDSMIEVNTFYKKIKFSNQELFLKMEQYAMKKMEYKLRSFCQIAEEMGSEKIKIEYQIDKRMKSSLYSAIQDMNVEIGFQLKSEKEVNQQLQLSFEYPTNHIHINLNKLHLMNKIMSENKFLMSREEFDADIELKYFIDARCTNFIQRYDTNFSISTCNDLERKIFAKALKYGIEINSILSTKKSIDLSISIQFHTMHDHFHLIDGSNIHVLREGFLYLLKMIQDEKNEDKNKYKKLIQFIKTHLVAIQNKWITLPYEFPFQDNVLKIYKQMIEQNFKMEEFELYIQNYFHQNIGWTGFLELRDILLKGNNESAIDKLHFVTSQYLDIITNKKNILDNIEIYIDSIMKEGIIDIFLEKEMRNRNNFDFEYLYSSINYYVKNKIKNEYFLKIKLFILNLLRKSFYYNGGLSNSQDIDEIREVVFDLFTYYFEIDLYKLCKVVKTLNHQNEFFEIPLMNMKQMISDSLNELLTHLQNNYFFSYSDNSPTQATETQTSQMKMEKTIVKNTILNRQRKFFVRFLLRYFQYENKMQHLYEYFGNNYEMENQLYIFVEKYFPIEQLFSNYLSRRLFYLFEDFEELKEMFLKIELKKINEIETSSTENENLPDIQFIESKDKKKKKNSPIKNIKLKIEPTITPQSSQPLQPLQPLPHENDPCPDELPLFFKFLYWFWNI